MSLFWRLRAPRTRSKINGHGPLWFAEPILNPLPEPKPNARMIHELDQIDAEIEKMINDARFKAAVLVAKAEIIDDLRAALARLEGNRG